MAANHSKLYPGVLLHDAIVGAFRANGGNIHDWCKRNDVTPSAARNATSGQSRGPAATALLERLIEAAGEDFVEHNYVQRLKAHAAELSEPR